MESTLAVTTPATDLTLLSLDELRAAANVRDGTQDTALKTLGDRVAARITDVCRVASAGATPPTLRQEVLVETFRMWRLWGSSWSTRPTELILARRPIVSVASVVDDGVTLDAAEYEILAGSGMLRRLVNDIPSRWCGSKIVVTYTAGWATVPQGLKYAAEQLVRAYWSQNARDPAVKSVNIPGVIERTFWVSAGADPDIPQDVMDALGPYMNMVLA